MTKTPFLILAIGFLSVLNIEAQNIGEAYPLSGDLLHEGAELYDKEKYTESIEKYAKIAPSDTNYVYALYEIALSHMALKEYDKCIHYAKEGLKIHSDEERNLLSILGSAYDEAGKPDSAVYYYNEGIRRYPYYHKFYFEMGVTLAQQKKDLEAYEYFQKSLRLNPFHAGSHLQLAELAARNDNPTCAMLAYETFMMLESGTDRYVSALIKLEKVGNNEYTIESKPVSLNINGGDNFAMYDEIIRSRAAQTDRYKTKVKLPYTNVIKQVQVLLEKLKYDPSDKGFFNTVYVPLFVKIWKEKQFEGLAYGLFAGLDNETAQEQAKKHKSDIEAAVKMVYTYLDEYRQSIPYEENGKVVAGQRWFYQNGNLRSVGVEDALKHEKRGHWKFFHSTGGVSAEGDYNDKAQRIGEWKEYYDTGELHNLIHYTDGQLDGTYTIYHRNGNLREEGTYVKGTIDGIVIHYYSTGAPRSKEIYKNGKYEGESMEYFNNGNRKTLITYVNNVIEGKVQLYYNNGTLSEDRTYKAGQIEGIVKEYFISGKLSSEGLYKNGKPEGEFKWYWENGKVYKIGSYSNGKQTGKWTEYNENGSLRSEYELKNDALDGFYKSYARDGRLYYEATFSNGKCRYYKYTGPDNQVLVELKPKNTTFAFVSYYENGNKADEGNFKNDNKEGLWLGYYGNGAKHWEENYVNGVQEGVTNEYYVNGQLKKTIMYKNGKKEGYYEEYFAHGTKSETGWYKDDDQAGVQVSYHVDGTEASREFFKDGKTDGYLEYRDVLGRPYNSNRYFLDALVQIEMYDTLGHVYETLAVKNGNDKIQTHFPNGKLYSDYTIKYDLRDGRSLSYFPNGQLNSERNYTNGLAEGDSHVWHPNKKKNVDSYYAHGKLDSLYKIYDEDGNLAVTTTYKNGEREGKRTWYYASGKVECVTDYHDDERDGYADYTDEDGTLLVKLHFARGIFIGYAYLGKDGKLMAEIPVKNETAEVIAYFPNGKKSFEAKYVNGDRQGKMTVYYTNGNKRYEMDQLNDDIHGKYTEYYANGKMREETEYKYGEEYGYARAYSSTGVLLRESYYVNGSKHGLERIFDATGKLQKQTLFVNGEPYEH